MDNKVYLIGAGPGDIELLTIKAVSILKQADVVVYDDTVDESCFLFCKTYVLRVKVGTKSQDEINELLIKHAKSGKTVVRLINGTPLVSSGPYEEFKALEKSGCETIIVSGVSATTSVAESFIIPLLDKNFNDSYRTINGDELISFDEIISHYHKRESLVIINGEKNLKQIVENLLSKNFPLEMPLAVLSKGSTLDGSIMHSNLGQINEQDEEFFETIEELIPAVIFIGENINASKHLY